MLSGAPRRSVSVQRGAAGRGGRGEAERGVTRTGISDAAVAYPSNCRRRGRSSDDLSSDTPRDDEMGKRHRKLTERQHRRFVMEACSLADNSAASRSRRLRPCRDSSYPDGGVRRHVRGGGRGRRQEKRSDSTARPSSPIAAPRASS